MGLQEFCDTLGASPASLALQDAGWAVPAIQSAHILALAVVLSSMAMLSARLMGFIGRGLALNAAAQRYFPPTWVALAVLLGTGLLLILAEPARELMNPAFRWKMALLALAVLSAVGLRRAVAVAEAADVSMRAAGALFISLWVAIAVLGRWIAYVDAGL